MNLVDGTMFGRFVVDFADYIIILEKKMLNMDIFLYAQSWSAPLRLKPSASTNESQVTGECQRYG